MRKIQDTFETRKPSFINAFSNCMTAPLSCFGSTCDKQNRTKTL